MNMSFLFCNLTVYDHLSLVYHLNFPIQKPTEIGDMMFSLSYLPTAERLTVVVVKARNIRWSHGKDQGGKIQCVYVQMKMTIL